MCNLKDSIDQAQAILVLTRWAEFEDLPNLLVNRPEPPLVIDGRRLLDPSSVARYEGIGFGNLKPIGSPSVL